LGISKFFKMDEFEHFKRVGKKPDIKRGHFLTIARNSFLTRSPQFPDKNLAIQYPFI